MILFIWFCTVVCASTEQGISHTGRGPVVADAGGVWRCGGGEGLVHEVLSSVLSLLGIEHQESLCQQESSRKPC